MIIPDLFPNEYPGKRNQPIAAIERPTREKNQKNQKTPKNEKTTRKLLREFYTDKKYLEGLLKDKSNLAKWTRYLFPPLLFLFTHFECFVDLVKSKMKNGDNLKDVIEETLAYLDICDEFWNQEAPGAPEKEKKINSKGTSSSPRMPAEPAEFLLKSLEDIDEGKLNLGLNLLLICCLKFLIVYFST